MANNNTQMIASPREKVLASAPAIPISRKRTTIAVEMSRSRGSSLLIVLFLILMG